MVKAIKRQSMRHLPEDVVEEILTNLSVKSLLRFKSVSKPWRSLISSKRFTKKHLNKSTNFTLLFSTRNSRGGILGHRSLSLNSLLHAPPDQHTLTTCLEQPLGNHQSKLIQLRGSCNGLILFTHFKIPGYPFLWNPSTRKLKPIPPPPSFQKPHLDDRHDFIYGLGYDDSTDDYKVVCVYLFLKPHPVQMYSLRSDSWKSIGNFEKDTPMGVSGMFVNGKMYWQVREKGIDGSGIVSLDLVEEKYQVLACPRFGYFHWRLHVLGGYLCVVCNKAFKTVWVMMKNGEDVEYSWTKIWLRSPYRPIWLTKNRDVAIAHGGSWITVYNSGENEGRHYKVEVQLYRGISCVESLVSPFDNAIRSMCSSSTESANLSARKLILFDSNCDLLCGGIDSVLNKAAEIGDGVFGTVYRASLGGQGGIIAIKKLVTANTLQYQEEFEREVRILGQARHPNLIPLRGYYWTPQLQLLLSDYAVEGSLEAKLHDSSPPLTWQSRFKIVLGIAKGLAYLHRSFRQPIVHYNVKPSNILLDEDLNPKISDFGLARLMSKIDKHLVGNMFQSAPGYVAPELCCRSLGVNEKCDVYGFGVLILEIVTGRRPAEDNVSDDVRVMLEQGNVLDCVDLRMGSYPEEEVLPALNLALLCTSQIPWSRPSMAQVVQKLEVIKTPPVPNRNMFDALLV